MKVLVLGATGFIGLPIALAYARAGHIVYGTTRNAKGARQLSIHEIIPVVTPASSGHGSSIWADLAAECDVVIDTIRSSDASLPLAALRTVESFVSRSGATRITYIFTGDVWSHSRGAGGLEAWSSEQQPADDGLNLAAWRQEVEDEVLNSERVNGIVIRPGVLYGRSASMLEPFLFAPAYDAAKEERVFESVGRPETRLQTIHQDDLADLFLRAGERGPILKGTALVAANPASERLTDILDAVVRVSGAEGWKLRKPNPNVPMEQGWASTTLVRPTLACTLTGWAPRKLCLVDGMDLYWSSFVAHYEGKKQVPPWDLPGVVPIGMPSRPLQPSPPKGSPPRRSPLASGFV